TCTSAAIMSSREVVFCASFSNRRQSSARSSGKNDRWFAMFVLELEVIEIGGITIRARWLPVDVALSANADEVGLPQAHLGLCVRRGHRIHLQTRLRRDVNR